VGVLSKFLIAVAFIFHVVTIFPKKKIITFFTKQSLNIFY